MLAVETVRPRKPGILTEWYFYKLAIQIKVKCKSQLKPYSVLLSKLPFSIQKINLFL